MILRLESNNCHGAAVVGVCPLPATVFVTDDNRSQLDPEGLSPSHNSVTTNGSLGCHTWRGNDAANARHMLQSKLE